MNENIYSVRIGEVKVTAALSGRSGGSRHFTPPLNALSQLKMIHRHSMYEMFFVPHGELSIHTVDGSVSYSHSVVLIPPHFDHYAIHDDAENGYGCIYFSLDGTAENAFLSSVRRALGQGVTAIPISEEEMFYFSRLEEEGNHGEKTEHLLALLLLDIFHRLTPRESALSSTPWRYGKYINAIETYLAHHYAESITLADLAEELYLCTKQVARIIRREYGCSISDLVNQRRLSVACMLLKYTELDIKEVAAQVGYEYENYFYTRFRKQYGVTPKQYREQSGTNVTP